MKDTKNLKNELVELSPFLAKMQENGDGLHVPEDYFKKLPNQFFEQLGTDSQVVIEPEVGERNWLSSFLDNLTWLIQPRPVMAFASILLLAFAGLFLFNQPTETQQSLSLSDIPMEELELFFADNIEEYDAEILVEGNENLIKEGFGKEDELENLFEEIIEESELEDLL